MRRKLALNVGCIPIVQNHSILGRQKSDAISRLARCSALQETLAILLEPLQDSLRTTFLDGADREFTPFLFSVATDLPEMAMVYSVKFGLNTAFLCRRCLISLSNIRQRYPSDARPRIAGRVLPWYRDIEK